MSDNQPLNISLDLTKVVTALPLIADGTMAKVRLKNITQNERDGNTILRWELVLVDPTNTVDGTQVQPGFPLFINFDLSLEFLVQKMTRFVDGFLGTGDIGNKKNKPERPQFNPELAADMIGREAIAKIVIVKSKKSDYVGNDIQTLTFPGDLNMA